MNEQEMINEVQLLHENKAELIETMQAVGVPATAEMPMSKIAELMKEAGGASCIVKVATVEETQAGQYAHRFFDLSEWDAMDTSVKQNYPRIGVLLVAEGQRIIIAREYQTDFSGAYSMFWSRGSSDVPRLTNYGDETYGMSFDYDSRENTGKILEHAEELSAEYMIAAQRCNEYRGCLNDPTYWCLPSIGHLQLILKYRIEIEAALAYIGGVPFNSNTHWSSTEKSNTHVWVLYFNTGVIQAFGKTNSDHKSNVRPVAVVD